MRYISLPNGRGAIEKSPLRKNSVFASPVRSPFVSPWKFPGPNVVKIEKHIVECRAGCTFSVEATTAPTPSLEVCARFSGIG